MWGCMRYLTKISHFNLQNTGVARLPPPQFLSLFVLCDFGESKLSFLNSEDIQYTNTNKLTDQDQQLLMMCEVK